MKRCLAWFLILVMTILLAARPAAAEDHGEVTAEQVRAAINRGVDFLRRTQNQDGSWPEQTGFPGGVTCLCTLALLNAGVPLDDGDLKRALQNIEKVTPDKTYVVSLQTMVWCLAEPNRYGPLIARNVQWLEELQNKSGPRIGTWSYSPQISGGDRSNTQFAMLALHEAERVGVPVSPKIWERALQSWLKSQNNDGSWGYFVLPSGESPGTGSMTCAGITSVYIASLRSSAGDAEVTANGLKCCGTQLDNPAVRSIDNGLAWLGNNFTLQTNPGSAAGWLMYYLYGIERVGRMTSHRFFISRDFKRYDWYRMGAETLVARQDQLSGYWKGDNHTESNPQISTSFALLFLAKGRRPVLVSKAKFGEGSDWSNHRSDIANLTTYVETKWKREFPLGLSWQVLDLEGAEVEDLLQTPVLYIGGSQTAPSLDEARKLRDYIDRGGFIFAEACCGDNGFDKGFRALMDKVFDEPEYRLKPLPPEHPIWSAEEQVRPALRPNLWAIDYGCRTSVVYAAPPEPQRGDLPHGLSCYWEIASGRDRNLTPQLQEQKQAALSIGINVLAYATNRELKSKDENFNVGDTTKKDEDTFERGKRYVANVRHPGGCDAAPGAGQLDASSVAGIEIAVQQRAAPGQADRFGFVQLRRAVHARPHQFSADRCRAKAIAQVSGARHDHCRFNLCEPRFHGSVPPRDQRSVRRSGPEAGTDSGHASDVHSRFRRIRSFASQPARTSIAHWRRSFAGAHPQRSAGIGRAENRRSLCRYLLAAGSELRAREARFARVRRLHSR